MSKLQRKTRSMHFGIEAGPTAEFPGLHDSLFYYILVSNRFRRQRPPGTRRFAA
ncbi:hypothetical protein [Derxia lacustris]|uniref:hypothetical protein n=1 Tax=Derxia lacustris TaxID=764842 RepID=UPI001594B991|nr:hypothetical protein [Derxia lacustris]